MAAAGSCTDGDSPRGDQGLCTCCLVCGSPRPCGSLHLPSVPPTGHVRSQACRLRSGAAEAAPAPHSRLHPVFPRSRCPTPPSALSFPPCPRGPAASCPEQPARPPSPGCCGEKGGAQECRTRHRANPGGRLAELRTQVPQAGSLRAAPWASPGPGSWGRGSGAGRQMSQAAVRGSASVRGQLLAASPRDPARTGAGRCRGEGGPVGPGRQSGQPGPHADGQVLTGRGRWGRGCHLSGRRGAKRTRSISTDAGPPLHRPLSAFPAAPRRLLTVSVIPPLPCPLTEAPQQPPVPPLSPATCSWLLTAPGPSPSFPGGCGRWLPWPEFFALPRVHGLCQETVFLAESGMFVRDAGGRGLRPVTSTNRGAELGMTSGPRREEATALSLPPGLCRPHCDWEHVRGRLLAAEDQSRTCAPSLTPASQPSPRGRPGRELAPREVWVLVRQPRLTDAGRAQPQGAQRHLPQAACPPGSPPVPKRPVGTSVWHVSLPWSSPGGCGS